MSALGSARLGIRARLTAIVVAVFAVVAAVAGWAVLRTVEHRLVSNARESAETMLDNYLRSVAAGGPMLATTDAPTPGTFFYLDAEGRPLSTEAFAETLVALGPGTSEPTVLPADGERPPPPLVGPIAGGVGVSGAGAETTTGPAVGDRVGLFAINVSTQLIGGIHPVELGEDSIAVAQRMRFPDGTELQVGVSAATQPIDASVSALTVLVWAAVPALTAAVGLVSWFAVGRALRPVHSITQRTREISSANLSERVPVPDRRDDIAELAVTMNDMLGRLDGAQRRQRQFVADASHELRSPVAASQAQLEVALAHPDRADWPATARTVLAEQQHLGGLVDDLLALGRLDEQGVGTTAPVEIGRVVADELARAHRHPVCADVCAGSPHTSEVVVGNAALLRRALRNLVDNADRHAASQVSITVSARPGRVLVHVDDDGPGVPVGERERIFERFTRLDEPRDRSGGGAGLGLAIVREVAQHHGGTATCTSSPLGGARFTLDLPTARP